MSSYQSRQVSAFRLGTEDIPRRQRFDAMREIIRPLYDALPLSSGPSAGMAFAAYVLDDVAVNRSTFDGHRLARGPEHLRQHDTDHIAARLYVRGRTAGVIGDLPLVMAAGSITLFDRRYEMHGSAEPGTVYGCMLPRDRIDTRVFDRTPALTWAVTSPQGRLLTNALLATWRALPRARPEDAAALAAGLIGLVNGLLSARPEAEQEEARERAALTAMQAFIEKRLHDRNLDVAILCQTFACSRARLYPCSGPAAASSITSEIAACNGVWTSCCERLGPSVGSAPWPPPGGSTIPATSTACSRRASGWRHPTSSRAGATPAPSQACRSPIDRAWRSQSCIAGSPGSSCGLSVGCPFGPDRGS
jgi:hypothetical protein